jgi:hypothetical protein
MPSRTTHVADFFYQTFIVTEMDYKLITKMFHDFLQADNQNKDLGNITGESGMSNPSANATTAS